jgi:hypothetical protein
MSLEDRIDGVHAVEMHDARSAGEYVADDDADVVGDAHATPGLQLRPRANQSFPRASGTRFEQHDFGIRAVLPRSGKSRLDDTRIIDDERISPWNQPLKITEPCVCNRGCAPVDDHQPAVVARRERMLCDPLGGKIEIVVGGAGPAGRHF